MGKNRNSIYFRIIGIAGCFFLVVQIFNKSRTLWRARNFVNNQEKRVQQLDRERANLEEKREFVENGDYWRREAADKLGLGKESDFFVDLPKDVPTESGFYKLDDPGEPANWRKWLALFVY